MKAATKDMRRTLVRWLFLSALIACAAGLGGWIGYQRCESSHHEDAAAIEELQAEIDRKRSQILAGKLEEVQRAKEIADEIILEMWEKTPAERARAIEIIKEKTALRKEMK